MQGDLKIFLTSEGASLKFVGGEPVYDSGLENQVIISLFSDEWFANIYFQKPSQNLDSKFEEAHKKPITVSALLDIENAARKDLSPMIKDGTASKIEVKTINTENNGIQTGIVIEPPGSDLFTLITTKHGLNWIAQANNPAYLKD